MRVLENAVCYRCEQCGVLLENDALGCLNCLLGGGLVGLEAENRRFQHYEVCLREDGTLDELGRGAMGITYRARDLNLDSLVALKIISAHFSDKAQARHRFRSEARAAAQLRHPNVASVFHFGEAEGGECFYVMELVEGETLEECVRRAGTLNASATLVIAEQVSRALVAAEVHGLVHRDLKPSNLMLVSNEVSMDAPLVKVIDFGLAQAVVALQANPAHPTFSGTPEFASPEQFDSTKPLDARSDIYSLGATLWYLLCGGAPFAGEPQGTNERLLPLEQLTERKVPAPLINLLRSMLANDPARRLPTAKQLLSAVQACRAIIQRKRRRIVTAFAGFALVLLIAGGFWLREIQLHREFAQETAKPALPEKSIAVLPFDNLTDEKEHTLLADCVQDDILIKLAKVADLKVIGRSSVMDYRGKQDVRQVGSALGVSNVLEGTVRRVGDKVHVNAQLVDTRTDQNIWADDYDRDLNDVFAIETEVAQSIAARLAAKLSAAEQAAIKEHPTKDLVAYDLYLRALAAISPPGGLPKADEVRVAIDQLNQAIVRDPNFYVAYCYLGSAHSWLYMGAEHTPARLGLAKQAIDSAFRLNPNAGEPHLALAHHYYYCYFDFDRARAELAIAHRILPNSPRVYGITAFIDRRQGRSSDAVRNMKHACELEPRDFTFATNLALFCSLARPLSYEDTSNALDHMLAIHPNDIYAILNRGGGLELDCRGDTRHLHATIAKMLADDPASADNDEIKGARFTLALFERDFDAARRLAAALSPRAAPDLQVGLVAHCQGDAVAARTAFTAARVEQDKILRDIPASAPPLAIAPELSLTGVVDAGLGKKEEALREGRRAVELLPITKDCTEGPGVATNLAWIYAWTGEHDLAIQQLEILANCMGGPNYGDLRLNPCWDSLRGDPRFEKLVASLAPKEN